jgi:hypothetical protein
MPKADEIAEIGIDAENRLYVRPKQTTYPFIYRAAMGVHWDPGRQVLHGDAPRELSHAAWFRQILGAVRDEYGTNLTISSGTVRSSVPEALRIEIEADRSSTR